MNNTMKIVTGIAVGTLVGATLGLLFAPKKGSKTRAMLANQANDLSTKAHRTYVQTKELLGVKSKNGNELVDA
ncbi:MAG: YtxH domain-containing protein [Cytophagales bacterium]|nr:YtxH domain-containing protein [Cytophagales bacterium]